MPRCEGLANGVGGPLVTTGMLPALCRLNKMLCVKMCFVVFLCTLVLSTSLCFNMYSGLLFCWCVHVSVDVHVSVAWLSADILIIVLTILLV